MIRRRLSCTDSLAELLRRLRDEPCMVALTGRWALPAGTDDSEAAVVGFDPVAVLAREGDPFEVLADTADASAGDDPGFGGGWIGCWGYQLGRRIEQLPPAPRRPYAQPDHDLGYFDVVVRRTSVADGWWLESIGSPERLEQVERRLGQLLAGAPPPERDYACGAFGPEPGPAGHELAVARTLEHLRGGDIFQANVCLRLEAGFDGDPLDLFCRGVQRLQPAYGAFLRFGDRTVASFSPELFLRRVGRDVRTAPIKGTAPLTADPRDLAGSAKNRAENVMIVDLMRNDLGRVCAPGSITAHVDPLPQRHTGVWHLVSEVTGTLRPGASDADLLRSTFPPGSVTGAPKVEAMRIIHEVEATGRELYTGAIGYQSPCAGLETSVVIRTFEFAAGRVWLGVGGGVVIDSTPAGELRECVVKAQPLLDAVGSSLDASLQRALDDSTDSRAEPGRVVGPAVPRAQGPRPDPARGVFDTLLVRDGSPVELEAHVARLVASLESVYGTSPQAQQVCADARAAAAGLTGPHRLRLTSLDGRQVQLRTVALDARPAAPWRLRPYVVAGGLGAHKWNDRRLLDAVTDPADPDTDPLLVDDDGTLLETGRGCVFVVTDDGVLTPAIDGRILPGVTRAHVLELLRTAQVPVVERAVAAAELGSATEVFVTNAIGGVRPVTVCAGFGSWPVGPTTRWLRAELEAEWAGAAWPAPSAVLPRRDRATVLLIDNYDSFVYNLAQYVAELGARAVVARNDALSVEEVARMHAAGDFTHLVVSPGPGTPADAGISTSVIARLAPVVPVLGVCLGHQCIGEVYGGRTVRAPEVVHGKPSLIHHDGLGVYAGLRGPLVAARYHSLVTADVPDVLAVTARTAAGTVMGVRHRDLPVEGVQIHPESILTPAGHAMLATFLAQRGAGAG